MSARYCFLLGCSNSGKSLLARALRCLEGTLFADEDIIPTFLAHLVKQPLEPWIREAICRGIANHLSLYTTAGGSYSRRKAISEFLTLKLPLTDLGRAFSATRSFDLFIVESNFFSLAPEFLAEAVPNSSWILLVRDGRDCADQLARQYQILSDEKLVKLTSSDIIIGRKVDHRSVPWWVELGRENEFLAASLYGRAIWMWKAMVTMSHDWVTRQETAGTLNSMILKYEDFVSAPVEHGERVIAFLQKRSNVLALRQLKKINGLNIGVHKQRARKELDEAERIAGAELRRFGYI
jgi:hypothetical protein